MSSPIAIYRSSSPSASSSASDGSDSVSFISTSSTSSSQALTYTRDELLALATSPLSQSRAPASLVSFPQIMRKTRRGVIEAYQALDYARSMSRDSTPEHTPSGSPSNNAPVLRTWSAEQPTPAPVWHADVYVPPARRAALARDSEQRLKPSRDSRILNSRSWRRPTVRAIQVQGRW